MKGRFPEKSEDIKIRMWRVWVNTSTFGGSPFKVGTEGPGVGENCGVPKASGRESMIRSDYIDHGRSSRAIIMTKGRTLHCERETGGVTI